MKSFGDSHAMKKILIIGEKDELFNELQVQEYIYSPSEVAKVPIDDLIELVDAEQIDTILCYADQISIASKLLWQSKFIKRYILQDTDDALTIEKSNFEAQTKMWDMIAKGGGENQISQTGWRSSRTGNFFTKAEMTEWVDNTFAKLRPYLCEQAKVLEIGVASGLTCCAVAPLVQNYIGIDLSSETLKRTQNTLVSRGITNVSLECMEAMDIGELGITDLDIVIINSVAQYFPGYNYFILLLKKLIGCVKEKATIFIGDIMDEDLRKELQSELHKCGKKSNRNDLYYPKRFIKELRAYIPEISEIEVSNKIGKMENELNRYRYDAVLLVEKDDNRGVLKHTKFQYAMRDPEFSLAKIMEIEA